MSRFIPSFISSMFGSGSAEDKPVQPISIDPTYICPLSGQIMTDPVIASNGLTYDRSSIHSYFATFQPDQEIISPSDALAKIERNVFPNIMLKEQIRKYRETIEPTSLVTISHSMSNTIVPNDGTNSKTLVLTIDPTPKAISNKPVGNDI